MIPLPCFVFHIPLQALSSAAANHFIAASTSLRSGTLEMPPALVVESPADVHAKETIFSSSPAVSFSGTPPAFSSPYMAEPPKISPAPVVSFTAMPLSALTKPEAVFVL